MPGSDARHPFADPDLETALGQAGRIAAAHLLGMRARRVVLPLSEPEREGLAGEELGEDGVRLERLLADVEERVLPYPMGNGHPRFFGWVNSPPAPAGIAGDMLAATLNPSCAGGDHAAIHVERAAVRWLDELVGFAGGAATGLLVSGGSAASLTCLAAARHAAAAEDGWDVRRDGLQGAPRRYVAYTSQQGHACLEKALELLGLGSASLRRVEVDARFRIDVEALRRAIEADRRAGLRPFCVAASAGTVNTGAVDPLSELAELCRGEGLWLHVDGAYGAFGRLDPSVAPLFAGLERADSLALDPHKWLSVPVECGCALVRRPDALPDAFSLVPPYVRGSRGPGGEPAFFELGFQQTRGFRALKLWLTLKNLGRRGLGEHVARANALARRLAELVRAADDLELASDPVLSIVCFRVRPPGVAEGDLDALNRRVLAAVQEAGEAFPTGTELGGRFVLRACILHYDTQEQDLVALVEAVRAAGRALA